MHYTNIRKQYSLSDDQSSKISGRTSIDYRVLIIIFGLAIGYQVLLSTAADDENFTLEDWLYLSGPLIIGILSLTVSKRYKGSEIFGKAYFFLGIGYLLWFIGDSLYFYYDYVLQIDAWPSPGDVFFAAFYVMATLHLYLNTKYFKPEWNKLVKIWLVCVPIVAGSIYSAYAYEYEWENFDVSYGLIFVTGASIVLAFAGLGASVFRNSILGTVWLLLVAGIFLSTVADIGYAYSEIFETFDAANPINTIWVASFMLITYALYKHRKIV